MSEAIVVENLVKKFKDITAVDQVSFQVKQGEIYGLLGPNGAGKTTTIHILTTLLRPTSGKVFVAGYDVVTSPGEVRKRIGIVFQDPSIDNQLTAYDNMYIHGRLYGLSGEELKRKIYQLLDFVDLKPYANKLVRYFSGGMRRRLEIARSLLHEPDILFLDEPTIGLDPQTRVKIWDYIMAIKKEHGMTIFLTTHYMDEADQLCERIAIMDHGQIKAQGTPEQLKSLLGNEIVYVKLDGNTTSPPCIESDYVESCKQVSRDTLQLVVKNAATAMPRIFEAASSKGLKIIEVSYRRPTLNEVFIYLTGRELRDSLEEGGFRPPHRRW